MKVEADVMVALGYGKFFRSDNIVGLLPIEEGRGPGKRTHVYVDGIREPFIASRSERAILRDMSDTPHAVLRAQDQTQLLADILDTISNIDPMLRTIIREQGKWDLNRLEEQIKDALAEEE